MAKRPLYPNLPGGANHPQQFGKKRGTLFTPEEFRNLLARIQRLETINKTTRRLLWSAVETWRKRVTRSDYDAHSTGYEAGLEHAADLVEKILEGLPDE